MNKIALKRLKRKRELKRRIKHHGNNNSCIHEHPVRVVKREAPPKVEKLNWWQKVVKFIRNMI